MAVQQKDIERLLRPQTDYLGRLVREGRTAIDRLPRVLADDARALDHAGMADTFRLLPNLDLESAVAGAKSYPETSAQHHALWAAIMMAMVSKKPLEAERYINSAETCAELALAAPVAEPTQTGVKSVQETTDDDGTIGLRLSGYASRFGEVDRQGEVMRKGAFAHIKDEWGAAERPPVYYNHGFEDLIGFRPIGECTGYKVTDEGLHVDVLVPRERGPKRFSGAVLRRFKDVYGRVAAGKTAGLSVGGTYAPTGRGIKRWNMSELSIVDRPCLPSATFVLRH